MCSAAKFYVFVVSMNLVYKLAHASAVHSAWPQLKNYDIWGSQSKSLQKKSVPKYSENTIIVNDTDYRVGKGILT